jgi:hypothetical protein
MNIFAQYIKQHGSIVRKNPVFSKIAKETGYSVETLYRAALGHVRSKAVGVAIGRYVPKKKRNGAKK